MSRPVIWSDTAVEHLADISRLVARTSPVYAERLVDRILARVEVLADFPELGHAVAEAHDPEIRELIERPYRIIYFAQDSRVDILAVIHGRRHVEWPA